MAVPQGYRYDQATHQWLRQDGLGWVPVPPPPGYGADGKAIPTTLAPTTPPPNQTPGSATPGAPTLAPPNAPPYQIPGAPVPGAPTLAPLPGQPGGPPAPPAPPPPPDPWTDPTPGDPYTYGPSQTPNPNSTLWWEREADPWSGGRDTGVYGPTYSTDFQNERYRQYIASLPGGSDSAFSRYAMQHFADQMALYMQATQQVNPNLTLDQYLSPALTRYLQQQFGLQSSGQQGQQYGPAIWAGRWVG